MTHRDSISRVRDSTPCGVRHAPAALAGLRREKTPTALAGLCHAPTALAGLTTPRACDRESFARRPVGAASVGSSWLQERAGRVPPGGVPAAGVPPTACHHNQGEFATAGPAAGGSTRRRRGERRSVMRQRGERRSHRRRRPWRALQTPAERNS